MSHPLVAIVGYCTNDSARIFCCTKLAKAEKPAARMFWRTPGAAFASTEIMLRGAAPYFIGIFDLNGLPSGVMIEYAIDMARQSDKLAADARAGGLRWNSFRLLPADRPLRIGLVSCNGVYEISDEGRRYVLWDELKRQIEDKQVDLVIHCGDQIYADAIWEKYDSNPKNRNLRPESTARVLDLTRQYREWYVTTWSAPSVAAVLGGCPNLMVWDDHDIYDGYGSHDEDGEPAQQAFLRAAGTAYQEFQLSHGPERLHPASSLRAIRLAETAMILLDARTNRLWEKQTVLGREQIDQLATWGEQHLEGVRRLYLVSSIPFIHANVSAALTVLRLIPGTEGIEDDLRDAWTAGNNLDECRSVLRRLFKWTSKYRDLQITILSGDVHVGAVGEITEDDPTSRWANGSQAKIYQVTASAIGKLPPSGVAGWLINLATNAKFDLGSSFTGQLMTLNGVGRQILSGRNFAVLDPCDASGSSWEAHGNLHLFFHAENTKTRGVEVLKQVLEGPGRPA